MSWDTLQEWGVVALLVGCVFLAKQGAKRKANRLRQEGRQEAVAAIQAYMQTGNQSVVVHADGGRISDERSAVRADLDVVDHDHDGPVPGVLGRRLRSVGRGAETRRDVGGAGLDGRRAADGVPAGRAVGPYVIGPDDDAASRIIRGPGPHPEWWGSE